MMSRLPHSTDNVIRLAQAGLRPQALDAKPALDLDMPADDRLWCEAHLGAVTQAQRILAMPLRDLETSMAALRAHSPLAIADGLADIGKTVTEFERLAQALREAQDRICVAAAAAVRAGEGRAP